MVDWNAISTEDSKIVMAIVERVEKLTPIHDKLSLVMDIKAAHISNPLRLQELLEADDANFGHDVFGIQRHMNRATGKLGGCFLPRFSIPQKELGNG